MKTISDKDFTKLQGAIAIASFSIGVTIASVCLFLIPPYGEISHSAIIIVSNLLVMCGAILGVKANFDAKLSKMQTEIHERLDKPGHEHEKA